MSRSSSQPLIAARELAAVDLADPDATRRQVVETLWTNVEADAAGFFGIAETHGALRIAGWTSIGGPAFDLACRNINACPQPVLGTPHDFRRAPPDWARRFLPTYALGTRELLVESPIYRVGLGPAGIDHQLRLLVVDGARLIGWLGLVRGFEAGDFTTADSRRLSRLVPALAAALVAADRLTASPLPEHAGDLVCRPDGHVAWASPEGRRWVAAPELRARLAAHVRAFDHGRAPSEAALFFGYRCRAVRLDGAGEPLYALQLDRLPSPTLAPSAQLSPRQRQVADLAAAGATVPEIAAHLSTSTETARSHLREIYRRLGVSTRVDLARRLRDG